MRYSAQGLASAWRHEAAFRQEVCLFALLAPLTASLGLPALTTLFLLALMALVLATELLNSALEAVVDKTIPEKHELAGRAKDCGSAAVFVVFAVSWSRLAGPVLWWVLFG